MKSMIYALLVASILLFDSCSNGNIVVDIPSQSIKTCGGENFKSIRITCEDGQESLRIEIKAGMKGTNNLNLFLHNPNYSYGAAFFGDDSIKFAIKPLSSYEIINEAGGDASHGEVKFRTNSLGRICYSSTVCND